MKLGRIWRQGPDGDVARIVAVHPDEGRVVDLATAEGARLQQRGATTEAARRLGAALFPSSMAAAIALGTQFLDAAGGRRLGGRGRVHVGRRRPLARAARPAGHPRLADLPAAHEAVRRTAWRRAAEPAVLQDPGLLQGLDRRRLRPRRGDPVPQLRRADRLRAGARDTSSARRPQPHARGGGTGALRPDDLQRLLGARHPGPGDGDGHGSAEVQGLRVRHRAVDHDDRRVPRPRRLSVRASVNGEEWATGTTEGTIYSAAELSRTSRSATGCSLATSSARARSATAPRSSSAATSAWRRRRARGRGRRDPAQRLHRDREQYPWWPRSGRPLRGRNGAVWAWPTTARRSRERAPSTRAAFPRSAGSSPATTRTGARSSSATVPRRTERARRRAASSSRRVMWITDDTPASNAGNEDTAPAGRVPPIAPPANGTILRIADFPPDTRYDGVDIEQMFREIGGADATRRPAPRAATRATSGSTRPPPSTTRSSSKARSGRCWTWARVRAHLATCSSSAGPTTPGRTAATARAGWRSS